MVCCPECKEDALELGQQKPKCRACGFTGPAQEVAKAYLEKVMGINLYRLANDGDEPPIHECPECEHETMLVREDEPDFFLCFTCGGAWDKHEFDICAECNRYRRLEESAVCSQCFDDKIAAPD
jgi:hypothetical protein